MMKKQMKLQLEKNVKWISITALLVVLVGLGITFAGYAAGGFDVYAIYNGGTQSQKEVFIDLTEEKITDIRLETGNGDIRMVPSQEDRFGLTISKDAHSYAVRDGVLEVESIDGENRFKWYRVVNWNIDTAVIVVEVPESFAGAIDIECAYGKVDIEKLALCENIKIKNKNGDTRLEELSVKKDITISTSYGSVDLDDIQLGENLTISNQNGDVRLKNMADMKAVTIEMKYGKCDLTQISGQTLSINNQNGDMEFNDVLFTDRIEGDSKYGYLKMRSVFAPEMRLWSENGDIRGSIAETQDSFKIAADCTFGDSNLAGKLDGSYTLDIKTKYGNIDVDFTG